MRMDGGKFSGKRAQRGTKKLSLPTVKGGKLAERVRKEINSYPTLDSKK